MTLPPYWEEPREPFVRSPRVVLLLLLSFAFIQLIMMFMSGDAQQWLVDTFGLVPATIAGADWSHLSLNGSTLMVLLPFVSYAFLHGDFLHLAVNSLALLAFGTVVARRVGTARFIVFALITAIAAAITHLVTHWGETVPVVGASGAISGMMGGATRFIFIDPRGSLSWPRPILPLSSRPVIVFSLVWTLMNVFFGMSGFSTDGFDRSIAWEAHLGGYFSGLLLFPLFDRQRGWLK